MEITYTPDTNDYMFRYLEKYIGKYRVMAHPDVDTNKFPTDESYEDFYIPCSRGCVIKSTYVGDDILALCFYESCSTAKNVSAELKKLNVEHEKDISDYCVDAHIYFKAKDLDTVAKVVKAKTNGKQIHPLSSRNLKKSKSSTFKIPEDELNKLYEHTKSMTRTEKLHFFKKINKAYIDKLSKKTKEDHKEKMKFDGLGTKEYIYNTGHWEDYVKFVNKEIKKSEI